MQKLTKEQAVIISAYTGILICDFNDMHRAIEEKLGRLVFVYSYTSKCFLAEVREAFKEDFLALAPDSTSN